ncbi:MAG: hypothetical protein ACOC32_00095 [Nanoarchaeota archaeon]
MKISLVHLGELVIVLSFGILTVLFAFAAQTGTLPTESILISLS